VTADLDRHLAARLDPVELARSQGWEPDPWQQEVLRSRSQWVAVNACRQAGKSATASLLGVWTAVYVPGSTVVVVSPSQRQSGELFRRMMVSYRALGRPVSIEAENLSRVELESGSRIIAVPGDADTVRGLAGVTLLIIDESSRVSDDLYAAVAPMLAVSGGRMVAISTPWGRRGWWHRACTDPLLGWDVTTVPATECARITPAFLEQARASMTDAEFRSEYLCEFIAGAGGLFAGTDIDRMFDPTVQPFDPYAAPLRAVPDLEETA
jgi:Terminase large subunit, T4likevirus-type, N-terminal